MTTVVSKDYGFRVLAICFAAVLWGFDGVVLTPRLMNLKTPFVVFILHALPFLFMNLMLWREYKRAKQFTNRDYLMFLAVALFGGALGTMSIVKALFLVNFNHLSVIVLLQKLQPIFAILLAGIFLKEKMNKASTLWVVIAIVSSYFLSFGFQLPHWQKNPDWTVAVLLSLLAAFSFGSSTVFSRDLLTRYPFKTVTFFRYGFTTLIMYFWIEILHLFPQISLVTPANWITFIIIFLTTGSTAIFIYYWGLEKVKAKISTICELFFPLSGILFDYLFNGSHLSLVQWGSVMVMYFAILKINRIESKS